MMKDWQKCILCDDSKNVIKRIPDNSIDFILTDPPYNIGKHSTGNIPLPGRSAMNNDVAEWDWLDFNPEEWADEFIRILKPTGNLFIFTSYNQLGRWYNCLDHKFDTSNFMIWHKTNPAPKIFKAGFLNSCEMIFTCWNKKHTWNFISQAEMHNFIESPICMSPERLKDPKHPAQKPISILKKMIEIASNPDDIIFDPFMGVGSTGVAALSLQRKFIGVELNKEYFAAANKRINEAMIANTKQTYSNDTMVNDAEVSYGQQFTLVDLFPDFNCKVNIKSHQCNTELSPIIKWPGGKEKELKHIMNNLPQGYKNFYEPFVGGGSVFTGLSAERYFINDKSDELIRLYSSISQKDTSFYSFAQSIVSAWDSIHAFFKNHLELVDWYKLLKQNIIDSKELKSRVEKFCQENKQEVEGLTGSGFTDHINVFISEIKKNLTRKMSRMKVLEEERNELPEQDLYDNIETALKSALYMYYRHLYNDVQIKEHNSQMHSALFLFIRNYCYSGMFRYNADGEFNVPYGGMGYNSKSLKKKLEYYQSDILLERFRQTAVYNLDFEDFLRNVNPNDEDFVFLDPPYDTEFSTYAQNEFGKTDQTRLANFLINECRAKWMLIIKYTPFIYDLYNKDGINIKTFDKNYTVSFMNRNDKKAEHLIIMNYNN